MWLYWSTLVVHTRTCGPISSASLADSCYTNCERCSINFQFQVKVFRLTDQHITLLGFANESEKTDHRVK